MDEELKQKVLSLIGNKLSQFSGDNFGTTSNNYIKASAVLDEIEAKFVMEGFVKGDKHLMMKGVKPPKKHVFKPVLS
jgi:hypothetical protein